MPEGPSIIILKELVSGFTGKKCWKLVAMRLSTWKSSGGKKVTAFKSWGKHFLICFPKFTVRIHLLLFGSYSINEKTKPQPRLSLSFTNGDLYFYACQVKFLTEPRTKCTTGARIS
ncbi:hypothetical protein MKQ70_16910 [Chitinophaga sedimenti]|uniref:hypothetical protein n=1 Tax=Chitinophaga sedimenti TaxID=2033606 RepID=UPI002002A1EB|nr:hypothetical protein [Chitinophaga sedimenti]MCK7556607.1 hypothetical protein [Chitinophaga sedimenti]